MALLFVHRIFALIAIIFIAYVCVTGAMVQTVDMATVLGHVPETDPNMMAVREHIDGPTNYAIVMPADYTSQALPSDFDYSAALAKVVAAARAAAPGAALRLVELRMAHGKPAGHVQLDQRQLLFNAATGAPMPAAYIPVMPPGTEMSLRSQMKGLHRGGFGLFGRIGVVVNAAAGIALSVLIFTGLVQYYRLLRGRARLGRRRAFWFAGGIWRSLHRWFALAASLFVIMLTGSGLALSLDCLGQAYNIAVAARHGINAHDVFRDVSSPMSDRELPGMLRTVLGAYRAQMPDVPIHALRLRYFSGIPQGVFIDGNDAAQTVFNAVTGKQMSETEPGYPDTGFPLGWQGHEILKKIHRGDFFGMTGRWTESIGALALLYLTFSGIKMYFDVWNRRRRNGHYAPVWR